MLEAVFIVGLGAFFTGACLASYFLVCSSRIEAKRAGAAYSNDSMITLLTTKRSHCPSCSKPLAFYELIPVVSYIIQLGSCRRCGSPIGLKSVVTELLGGASAVLLALYLLNITPEHSFMLLVFASTLFLVSVLAIFKGLLPRIRVAIKAGKHPDIK